MAHFEFRDVVINGENVIDAWLDDEPGARAKYDSAFGYLAESVLADWGYPLVVPLQGYDGLLEFRVRVGKVRYRIGGFLDGNRAILCTTWTHNEKPKVRRRAMDLAAERKRLVLAADIETVPHV